MRFKSGMDAIRWYCEARSCKAICGKLSLRSIDAMIDVEKALNQFPMLVQRALVTYALDSERRVKRLIQFDETMAKLEATLKNYDYMAVDEAA